jgi:threonine/homoserine/homoserine lactone efflux protein
MIEVQWFMFLLAAVAVISTPGQDMLLVMCGPVV